MQENQSTTRQYERVRKRDIQKYIAQLVLNIDFTHSAMEQKEKIDAIVRLALEERLASLDIDIDDPQYESGKKDIDSIISKTVFSFSKRDLIAYLRTKKTRYRNMLLALALDLVNRGTYHEDLSIVSVNDKKRVTLVHEISHLVDKLQRIIAPNSIEGNRAPDLYQHIISSTCLLASVFLSFLGSELVLHGNLEKEYALLTLTPLLSSLLREVDLFRKYRNAPEEVRARDNASMYDE